MIRSLMLAACFFVAHMNVFAQQTQPTRQAPAKGNKADNPAAVNPVYTSGDIDLSDTANENRLVALVLKGPEYDASIHQGRITELELKRAKMTWLNLLTISTNYNDQSFAKPAANANGQPTYVYPKYFFGITI